MVPFRGLVAPSCANDYYSQPEGANPDSRSEENHHRFCSLELTICDGLGLEQSLEVHRWSAARCAFKLVPYLFSPTAFLQTCYALKFATIKKLAVSAGAVRSGIMVRTRVVCIQIGTV